uniref:Uncharacterized protein LOC116954767 n=1 Tax=Petromyzon marinus TaxID=7757 RepID=A0AAJ7XEQ0_PETMA|nr:uncharacterized protein LOC116954767 [Petromyzon marinus]
MRDADASPGGGASRIQIAGTMAAETTRGAGGALGVLQEAEALLGAAWGGHDEGSREEVATAPAGVAYERSMWELRTVKRCFMARYANHHMVKFLCGDEDRRLMDAAKIGAELAATQREVKRLKGACGRVEEAVGVAADALCDNLERLEVARDALRVRLAARSADANPNNGGKVNKEEIQKRVEKLRVAEESLQLQREAIARYRVLLAAADSELAQANETAARQGRQLAEREWEVRASQLLQGLCDIRLLPGATEEALSVEMTLRKAAPLRLDLSLHPDGTVSDVQTSRVVLGIEDLCDGGRGVGKVSSVLAEIRRRYEGQAALVAEVQRLQSRFAVDWRESERQMRVLLGATASVVCTLHAPPGYPATGSGATLLSVTGAEPRPDISTLRPPQDSPTLTDWLAHLQQLFA